MASGAIKLDGVTKIFSRSDSQETLIALDNIQLDIKPGEFISIVGASGCGKSTLLRIIAGLEHPTQGTAVCDGKPILGTSAKRGLVFQDHALFPWLTVWGNVTFGLWSLKNYSKKQELAEQLLESVELKNFKKSYPHQLSGGMSQRVALIRALATEPDVLLLDEPLGALDAFTRMNIQDVLIQLWQARGNTMILITHDVDEAIYLSQRVIVMSPRPGRIVDELRVDLTYPRNRSNSAFVQYRNRILERLNLAHEENLNYYII